MPAPAEMKTWKGPGELARRQLPHRAYFGVAGQGFPVDCA
jgi:hypothetical protein